jgi:hypothetical protein
LSRNAEKFAEFLVDRMSATVIIDWSINKANTRSRDLSPLIEFLIL